MHWTIVRYVHSQCMVSVVIIMSTHHVFDVGTNGHVHNKRQDNKKEKDCIKWEEDGEEGEEGEEGERN